MNPAVGIDLGTTNTVVGVQTDDYGPEVLAIPQPVQRRRELEDQHWIKSAVLFESADSAAVGAFAADRLESFRSVKSRMGTRWRVRHPFLKDRYITAPYVSAHVLRLAHDTLLKRYPQWDRTALITVPASFNSAQRSDTLLAAKLAGFNRVDLLDEPTAAFYYHFVKYRDNRDEFKDRKTILVFDFGGGTLDVSIIEVQRDGEGIDLDAIGRSRYNNLGGDDIDYDIAAAMLACWKLEDGGKAPASLNPEKLSQVFVSRASKYKEEVEDRLKHGIPMEEFRVIDDVPLLPEGAGQHHVQFQRTLSRGQYEEIAGRYFREASGLNIFRPIVEALAVAAQVREGFSKDQLHLVLYTGGASQMNGAQAALAGYFGKTPCLPISEEEPCHTVALGAAACRHDELHRRQNVRMKTRLLETIFTRSGEDNRQVPIVPLYAEPSEEFRTADDEFQTPRKLIRLVHPLFRGVRAEDHQLGPLGDLRVNVGRVVERDTPYRLAYRVTRDMTVEFRAKFSLPDGPLECPGEVVQSGTDTHINTPESLAAVNRL
jgi:molecular chaperone DnaK (HSP70)